MNGTLAESLAEAIITAYTEGKTPDSIPAATRAARGGIRDWIAGQFPTLTVVERVDPTGGYLAYVHVLVEDAVALLVHTGLMSDRWKTVDRDVLVINTTRPDLRVFVVVYDPALPNLVKDRVHRARWANKSVGDAAWVSARDPESLVPLIEALNSCRER